MEKESPNSSLRSKKSRENFNSENNITKRTYKYSKNNFSENQIKNNNSYKQNKRNTTLNNSYHSTSLKLEWDYKNPCEL